MRLLRFLLIVFLICSFGELSARAAVTGTAWGTLLVGPQCANGTCTLQLTTGSGDLTVVTCSGGFAGPCGAIPAGHTVVVSVAGAPVLCPFSPYASTALAAVDLPRHYAPSMFRPKRKAVAAAYDLYWGPVKGTIARASQFGAETRVAVYGQWPAPPALASTDACLVALNSYGPSVGDPYLEIPVPLVQALGSPPQAQPFPGNLLICTSLLAEGACVSVSGRVLPSPDLFGRSWVVDEVHLATCP